MEQTNLYSITIPPMRKGLVALSALLDKASEHADSKKQPWATFEHALLADHIIFDQFPLLKQIQIVCDNAKGAAGRLAEVEIPKHEDVEKTIPELKERIAKTIAFLDTIKPEQVAGKENIKVTLPYFENKFMTGFDYVTGYLIPNFYFHLSTAYNLMRKNGITIGKNDYLGGAPLQDM